ncbi:hypothetical protein D9G37_26385 [Escherichia coli]|nr:hypothetical protein [Escherichia coli]EEW7849158.1 hypothetical protein [Escherichia coli]EFO3674807.1 hypothetical protein [Escherichia coli]MGQ71046.1 hypothetical protein [Escherichia coli]
MEQSHDLTNRNLIQGSSDRQSEHMIAKAIAIKGRMSKSGRCVAKAVGLTPGGLYNVLHSGLSTS